MCLVSKMISLLVVVHSAVMYVINYFNNDMNDHEDDDVESVDSWEWRGGGGWNGWREVELGEEWDSESEESDSGVEAF